MAIDLHMQQYLLHISLWDNNITANTERFQGLVPLLPRFCPLSVPNGGGGGYVGYIWKALQKGYLEHPGLYAVLTTCLRFSSVLDGVCAACCLFLSTGCYYVCIQIHATCCCFPRCTTETFGAQKGSLWGCRVGACDSRFVWVKSGYSEAIAWRKAQLTKQRNVDLTTDGLWAMPLNTGCVPVKARRLQDWEKLKKYRQGKNLVQENFCPEKFSVGKIPPQSSKVMGKIAPHFSMVKGKA